MAPRRPAHPASMPRTGSLRPWLMLATAVLAQAAGTVFQSAPAEERQALVPRTARGLEDAPWIAGPKSAVVEQDVLDSMLGDAGESVEQLAES